MTNARTIQLVVLDWAGTTVDFGCFGPVEAFARSLARHGVTPSPAQVRSPMGAAKKDHLRALLEIPELAHQWLLRQGRAWDESDVERIYRDDYIPLQLETIGHHAGLVPGLLPTVEQLRKDGLKIATTTGYFREAAALVFESARQQGYVPDLNVLPDEVAAGRPAPWMIFKAMEAFGVEEPSAVVKLGDTPVDIAEGRNAGVWSVGVISSSSEVGLSETEWSALSGEKRREILDSVRSKFDRAGAHAVIETIAELPEVIATLGRSPRDPTS